MKKKVLLIFSLFLTVLLMAAAAVPAFADDITSADNRSYFADSAGIVNGSEWQEVNSKLLKISDERQCGVYILTTDSFDGKDKQAYADDYYDSNGLGYGNDHSGILLVVNYDSGDWVISTTGSAISDFTDAGQQYIMEAVAPELRDNPAEAFKDFADLCSSFIKQAESGEAYDSSSLPDPPKSFNLKFDIPVGIVIGCIIAYTVMRSQKNKLKSVRREAAASNYVRPGSMDITNSSERFLYSTVTRTRRINDDDDKGSSIHVGSSGIPHGGSSGKF